MPHLIVRLRRDTLLQDLRSLLASEKYILANSLDAPAEMVLEASRSNWKHDEPQGCIVQAIRLVPTQEDDSKSPTNKKMEQEVSYKGHLLDCMLGPAEPKLKAGQKILVCDFLS